MLTECEKIKQNGLDRDQLDASCCNSDIIYSSSSCLFYSLVYFFLFSLNKFNVQTHETQQSFTLQLEIVNVHPRP